MDKLTRKELKSDKFALEVQHGVEFVSEHRKQMLRWGPPAIALVLIIAGLLWYRSYARDQRQEALYHALKVQNSTISAEAPNAFVVTFPTTQAREEAVVKTWKDLAAKYSGSEEAAIAEYFLGTTAADAGNLADATRYFQAAIDGANAAYASQAKLALAEVYGAQGKVQEGEKLIQSVIDHPTVVVSKDAAVLAMADLIKNTDPKRAHQLVDPLRTSTRSAVSRAAITLEGSLSKQ